MKLETFFLLETVGYRSVNLFTTALLNSVIKSGNMSRAANLSLSK